MTKPKLDEIGGGLELIEEGRASGQINDREAAELRGIARNLDLEFYGRRAAEMVSETSLDKIKKFLGLQRLVIIADNDEELYSFNPHSARSVIKASEKLEKAYSQGIISERYNLYKQYLASLKINR